MLLTEEEAKENWCPQEVGRENHSTCIASNCMAWRWEELKFMFTEAYNKLSDEEKKPKGYCGLAGRVE